MKSVQETKNTPEAAAQTIQTAQTSQTTPKKSPTAAEALALINSMRGEAAKYGHHDGWIVHSICVGECAGKLATAIRKNQTTEKNQVTNNQPAEELINPDHAAALGYLHDIGKGVGPFSDHPLSGYHYLKDNGYTEDLCSICLTHSFTNNECEMISGYRPDDTFLQDYISTHENTLYEDIATLCDLYCSDRLMSLESRLIDVIIRYGASDRTAHRLEEIYRLKAKIEQKLGGKTVEDVFDLPPSGLSAAIYNR